MTPEKHHQFVEEHQEFLVLVDLYKDWLTSKISLSPQKWEQVRYIVAAFGVGGRSFAPTSVLMFLAVDFIPHASYNFKEKVYDPELFEAVFLLQFALHKHVGAPPITRKFTRESLWSISRQVDQKLQKANKNS